jgi:ZIP family zinc transporter
LLPAEGIALGVPVFFATGSRWKAIGWAAASGLAEPLGALIGLALQLTGRLNPMAMGIIMAVVAGVMTGIAFQELLPRYVRCAV